MDEREKELNRKAQQAEERQNYDADSDEEFAEKMYDDKAPTPDRFDEQHEVNSTGQEIQE